MELALERDHSRTSQSGQNLEGPIVRNHSRERVAPHPRLMEFRINVRLHEPRSAAVPAASSRGVPLGFGSRGETPPELAGEDAYATERGFATRSSRPRTRTLRLTQRLFPFCCLLPTASPRSVTGRGFATRSNVGTAFAFEPSSTPSSQGCRRCGLQVRAPSRAAK